MRTKNKILYIITGIVGCLLVLFLFSPTGVRILNNYGFSLHKTDDETNYKTLKKVEDTCRAMISSYESDRLIYEQYKDSESSEKQSWSEQAKMRANKTASSYNNFILKNNFIWKDDVPGDIKEKLEILE